MVEDKFEAWWAKGDHGWGTQQYGAEYSLAKAAFIAGVKAAAPPIRPFENLPTEWKRNTLGGRQW